MRTISYLFVCLLIPAQISRAEQEKAITDFAFSATSLMKTPFNEMRKAEIVSLEDLVDKDRPMTLAKLRRLPKLDTLKFYHCDLSGIDEKDPVPERVKAVLISGGKVSQGTIRWLSKFPSGSTLVFGCDVRGLEFSLGKFSWLTFDNCRMSRTAVTKLVETMTQVTFKEVDLQDEK